MKILFVSLFGISIVAFLFVFFGLLTDIKYKLDDPINKAEIDTDFLYNKLDLLLICFTMLCVLALVYFFKKNK